MADIVEFVEDIGDGAKKVFKNKKFLLAAAVVGGVAIASGYMRYRKEDTAEETDLTAYEAIGYAGYPVIGGGGGGMEGDSSYYSDFLAEIDSLNAQYDKSLLEMESNVNSLSEKLKTSEEAAKEQALLLQRQQDISQMRANSELYNQINSADQRAALHEENKEIAEKYGWKFNSETGNWYEGDSVLYLAAWQEAQAMGSNGATNAKTTAAKATTTYTNNRTYEAKKAEAAIKGSKATTVAKK